MNRVIGIGLGGLMLASQLVGVWRTPTPANAANVQVPAIVQTLPAQPPVEVLGGGGCCTTAIRFQEDIVDLNPVDNLAYWYHYVLFESGDQSFSKLRRPDKRFGIRFLEEMSYAQGEIIALGPNSVAYPLGGGVVDGSVIFRASRPGTVVQAQETIINPDGADVDWVRFRTNADVMTNVSPGTCDQTCARPACSDGVDNDGDGLIDSADPSCHTDGNRFNPNSYNPNINSEWPQDCGNCGGTPSPNYGTTDPNMPLTPDMVRSWCVSGDCSSWRFTQLRESDGFINPHAVKLEQGGFATINLPAGAYAQHPFGTTQGPSQISVNVASIRHTGH